MSPTKPRLQVKPTKVPYSRKQLHQFDGPPVYRGSQLTEVAMPIGGIGAGSISLGGWGQLRDWEIFNRPGKGQNSDCSFFSLWAKPVGGEAVTKVLCGPSQGSQTGAGRGTVGRDHGQGLAHFRDCTFTGGYPFGRIDFEDRAVPLRVSLEAFNPLIPLNDRDSSIPCAIFLWTLTNPTGKAIDATLFANLNNEIGRGDFGGNVNRYRAGKAMRGLAMSSKKFAPDSESFGTMALATPHKRVTYLARWHRGGWFDRLTRFWDQAKTGRLPDIARSAPSPEGSTDTGSIGLRVRLAPKQSVTLPVVIAWHFPNFTKYWQWSGEKKGGWQNYYATQWADAWAVGEYVGANLKRLESESRRYTETLFDSTLPSYVLDAVSSQTSTLKTTTCIRLEDGTFWGWEGCHPDAGCCPGTCSHVWGYEQTLPYLFPALSRSVHDANYAFNLHRDGHLTFRMPLPLGNRGETGMHAAADGQLGQVMRVYRDWRLCGDDDWLRKLWPAVKRSLEYAWVQWDKDKDGVLEAVQHNTYDIEFLGPNAMLTGFYLGALRAGERMARYLGEDDSAEEYARLAESGRQWMDKHLFNGHYYVHEVRPDVVKQDPRSKGARSHLAADDRKLGETMPKHQYASGCLSDQMLGQWFADMLELGDLFNPKKVERTAESIFRFNWRDGLFDHDNPQRIYACDDEPGLLLCSWPFGGKPSIPFPYSDEVWTGIEYSTASFLIGRGLVNEGLAIVKGARSRHDGTRRNPFNEFECGSHYARAMASYGLLLALSGFAYSAPEKRIAFRPVIREKDFRSFFCVADGWGQYTQQKTATGQKHTLEVRYGHLRLKHIDVSCLSKMSHRHPPKLRVTYNGKAISAKLVCGGTGPRVVLQRAVRITAGRRLVVQLTS